MNRYVMRMSGGPPEHRSPSPGVVLPAGWKRPSGYSNGMHVPAGRDLLFVAGQIGWDENERLVGADLARQFEQALRNCVTVVEAAGGSAHDIVRLTMYCTDRAAYLRERAALGSAYRRVMGAHYPSMSLLLIAALVEEGALIEVEATAAIPATVASVPAGAAAGRGGR